MEKLTGTLLMSLLFIALFQHCTKEKVAEPLSIILTAHDVSTFLGEDGFIELDVTGGIPPYIYSWSNGKTTKDIDELKAGLYSVLVQDAADSTVTGSAVVKQPIPDNVVIDKEGNIYTSVIIGDQIWMQQNLRVTVAPDSTPVTNCAYNNDEENAKTYGRLYSWDVAMNGSTAEKAQGICPSGWHIPSDNEWKTLEIYLGMSQAEADLTNSWRGHDVGTKLSAGGGSGYEALYSGRGINSSSYNLLNQFEYVWTSTEYGQSYAWRRCLEKGVSTVGRWNTFPKTYLFSVRCIKDD
jgi:uncharacterized protein (TIGR02145 family)